MNQPEVRELKWPLYRSIERSVQKSMELPRSPIEISVNFEIKIDSVKSPVISGGTNRLLQVRLAINKSHRNKVQSAGSSIIRTATLRAITPITLVRRSASWFFYFPDGNFAGRLHFSPARFSRLQSRRNGRSIG